MMRCSPITLPLALLLAGTAAAQLDPNDPDFAAGNQGTVKIFHIGPYTVPAGRQIGGRRLPGEFEQVVPAPNPGDVWVTGYDNRLVDGNRVPVDQTVPEGGSDFYLHHAVFVNRNVRDLTCSLMPGERFAASGGERIPLALPDGYGYRVRGTDRIACIIHIQNFTLQPRQLYLQYSLRVQPGSKPLVAVRPWWLDVVPCTSSYFVPAGTGTHVKTWSYTAPASLTLLTFGPHLHCGGMQLDLIDLGTQQTLRTFNNDPNACPVQMQAELPSPPVVVPSGTRVQIRATYRQDPSGPIDAMGIVLGYAVVQ